MGKMMYGFGIKDTPEPVTESSIIRGKQVIHWRCPHYEKWRGMLRRCYSEKELKRSPTYRGCIVCVEWKYFSNFRKWSIAQGLTENNTKIHLDKDLRFVGNKEYSPNTCSYVTQRLNSFITDSGKTRGKYPLGVYFNKQKQKYQATCSAEGSAKFLGYYSTPEEAHAVWKKFKLGVVEYLWIEGEISCEVIYSNLKTKYT